MLGSHMTSSGLALACRHRLSCPGEMSGSSTASTVGSAMSSAHSGGRQPIKAVLCCKPGPPRSGGAAAIHVWRRRSKPVCQALYRAHTRRRPSRGRLLASCGACCGATAVPPGMAVGAGAGNMLQRGLRWLLARTGLLQAAKVLEDNRLASVASVLLFSAALMSSLAADAQLLQPALLQQISTVSTAAVYVLAGVPEAVEVCLSLAGGEVDTHVLMTLAALGTLLMGRALEGALLLVLFNVSHALEHALTERAQGDLAGLLAAAPQTASLVRLCADGSPDFATAAQARAADVHVGACMLVRPGEQVPLDGVIEWGEADVSAEHITGEALPARRAPREEVPAGARALDGTLVVRATRPAAQSTLARIAQLARQARANRPRVQSWLDSFGARYSRVVVAATAAALLVLYSLGVPLLGSGAERGALYRAMGLLTAASPCAVVLVPLAYVSAIAAVSRRGILVTGGRVLDALAACSAAAFDKTGTLTTGVLAATAMRSLGSSSSPSDAQPSDAAAVEEEGAWAHAVLRHGSEADRRALALAVALSQRATHPVSRALTRLGTALGPLLPQPPIQHFCAVSGRGVEASTQGEDGQAMRVRFGSVAHAEAALVPEQAARVRELAQRLTEDSVVSVLVEAPASTSSATAGGAHPQEQPLIRLFTFAERVRESSAASVGALQSGAWRSGAPKQADALRVMMLTGDNPASALRIGRLLGITEVHAGLAPEEKLRAVEDARRTGTGSKRGTGVIMVGDGINDAPALAAADVGIAVAASPSEAAAAVADVILLSDAGAEALPFLLAVAQRTQSIVRQNMALAVGSILALALPALLGAIPLWLAVACHEGSTVLVALNSLRLLR